MYQNSKCDKKFPFSAEKQDTYMRELFAYGKSVGVTYYRSGINEVDLETGIYKQAWKIDENNSWQIVKNIKPDAIADYTESLKEYSHYVKLSKLDGVIPVCNQSHFRREVVSKLSQYLLFKEFMSPSSVANNQKQLLVEASKFSDKDVVIKPFHGQQGFGVLIGKIEELVSKNSIEYPIMIQKFVNSNYAIKGTEAKGFIDLRLTFVNHELIYALSRVAEEGSCLTNTSQGGRVVAVSLQQVPQEVLEIAKKFQQKIIDFKYCTYCIDFLFDNGKPVVVEMNTRPSTELLYKTKNKAAIKRNIIATTNQFLDIIK